VNGVAITGDFNNIIEITLDTVIADAGDQEIIEGSTIGFAPAPGGDVFSIAGETANGASATFQSMERAADLGIDTAQLLQGSGQTGFGAGATEIWVAVDFSDSIDAAGDADQFELVNA